MTTFFLKITIPREKLSAFNVSLIFKSIIFVVYFRDISIKISKSDIIKVIEYSNC